MGSEVSITLSDKYDIICKMLGISLPQTEERKSKTFISSRSHIRLSSMYYKKLRYRKSTSRMSCLVAVLYNISQETIY